MSQPNNPLAGSFDSLNASAAAILGGTGGAPSVTAAAVRAARSRLALVASESKLRKLAANGTAYYGTKTTAHFEEMIEDIVGEEVDAVVTRNHYGSLVLNAARTLFIDVDFSPPRRERLEIGSNRGQQGPWQTVLDDLSLVLVNESDLGFRIYRTKAGFRMLATNLEFEPQSPRTKELMHAVSADAEFVQLCQIQKNFRARLTPKPWRCGAKRPPNFFPRRSPQEQRAFSQWLAGYERACCGRATCQYLGYVGSREMHPRIAPVVELHDRETKAFQPLPLA